jgi:DNA repair ATPase RecN
MMGGKNNIDKFGRMHSKTKILSTSFSLKLTSDGCYDIHNKRLCNAAEPRELQDVTTRNYVDRKFRNYSGFVVEECKKMDQKIKEMDDNQQTQFKKVHENITSVDRKSRSIMLESIADVTEKMLKNNDFLKQRIDKLEEKAGKIDELLKNYEHLIERVYNLETKFI